MKSEIVITELEIELLITSEQAADSDELERNIANLFGPAFYPITCTEYFMDPVSLQCHASYILKDFASWSPDTNKLKRINSVLKKIDQSGYGELLHAELKTLLMVK